MPSKVHSILQYAYFFSDLYTELFWCLPITPYTGDIKIIKCRNGTFSHKVLLQIMFTGTQEVLPVKKSSFNIGIFLDTFCGGRVLQCCIMSTEAIQAIQDWSPRRATLTFTHLSFVLVVLLARPFKLCVNNLASTDLVTLTLFQGQKCERNIHCIFVFVFYSPV